MAVFVELTTDAFEETRTNQYGQNEWLRFERVARRPMRGLEIKEDTPAAIKVVQSDGVEIPLVDAGAPDGTGLNKSGYTNFLLQSVEEARMEKHQIVETFGAAYVFFFGEAPRFLDVQMRIINSFDFNWEAEWWENYENNFRGTKLVERGARLYMFYDDNVVEGYMLNSHGVKVADQPLVVQMNFRLFVTSYRNISLESFSGGLYPVHDSAFVAEPVETADPNVPGSLSVNKADAAAEAVKTEAMLAEVDRIIAGDFDDQAKLTSLAKIPSSGAITPEAAQATGQSVEQLLALAHTSTGSSRGKIAANKDEYLGMQGGFDTDVRHQPPGERRDNIAHQEVEDLSLSSVEQLASNGADINNPDAVKDLGLVPPTAQEEEEEAASFGEELVEAFVPNVTAPDDPLASIIGSGEEPFEFGVSSPSKFGDGPGYSGQIGYGTLEELLGGSPAGSSQGSNKDPGYKAELSKSARLSQKTADSNSVFGGDAAVKLDASHQGRAGGASTSTEQRPAFSLVSTESLSIG